MKNRKKKIVLIHVSITSTTPCSPRCALKRYSGSDCARFETFTRNETGVNRRNQISHRGVCHRENTRAHIIIFVTSVYETSRSVTCCLWEAKTRKDFSLSRWHYKISSSETIGKFYFNRTVRGHVTMRTMLVVLFYSPS